MAAPILSECITLNDGTRMPLVGLGTFQGSYDYGSLLKAVTAACESALTLGYRHFDTAWLYNTEEGLGAAIRNKVADGTVRREDLFITSKLWCTGHRRGEVVPALRRSLAKLQLDYVDNWLVHWPCAIPPSDEDWPKDEAGMTIFEDDKTSLTETWEGMEECKKLGLARTIGVSNYNVRQLQLTLDHCSVKPSNHQVESHPHFSNRAMVDFCRKHDIAVVAYSPLGKPHRPWYQEGEPVVFTDPVLTRIASKYNKTPAQVALKFQVQRGVAVVPKSSDVQRQRQNLDIFDFQLSQEDIQEIFDKCDKYDKVLWLKPLMGHSKEYPF